MNWWRRVAVKSGSGRKLTRQINDRYHPKDDQQSLYILARPPGIRLRCEEPDENYQSQGKRRQPEIE